MTIISLEKHDNKFHLIESQSHRTKVWMDGYIEVPEELTAKVNATGGWCDLIVEDGILVDVMPTEKPDPFPTPADKRKNAYETLPIIEWDGLVTVDAANRLWTDYAPEDNPKADELSALIKEAKAKIRDMYPD